MKTILVCVDESDLTPEVVQTATRFATGLGAKLFILEVVSPLGSVLADEGLADSRVIAEQLRGARENLERQRESARLRGADATPLLVEAGNPASAIVHEATRLGADLLVMGSHGHGALYHLLVGSTTEGVLRKAPCPVLVVPVSSRAAAPTASAAPTSHQV